MEEIYRLIEEKIKASGYLDYVSGEEIYDEICDAQDEGKLAVSWIKGIYPTEDTAMAALKRDDLFVIEEDSKIIGTGIINQKQMDAYYGAIGSSLQKIKK